MTRVWRTRAGRGCRGFLYRRVVIADVLQPLLRDVKDDVLRITVWHQRVRPGRQRVQAGGKAPCPSAASHHRARRQIRPGTRWSCATGR